MNEKSPTTALAIASVFANLINKATFELSAESVLVLESLQRANPSLKEMSISEIGNYLSGMSDESIRGLANNVKGIYHELLFVQKENTDGDDVYVLPPFFVEVPERTLEEPVSDLLMLDPGNLYFTSESDGGEKYFFVKRKTVHGVYVPLLLSDKKTFFHIGSDPGPRKKELYELEGGDNHFSTPYFLCLKPFFFEKFEKTVAASHEKYRVSFFS